MEYVDRHKHDSIFLDQLKKCIFLGLLCRYQIKFWQQHPVYDNHSGSNLARVKNTKTKRLLTGHLDKEGYTQMGFYGYDDDITIKIGLHVFVFECFFNKCGCRRFKDVQYK